MAVISKDAPTGAVPEASKGVAKEDEDVGPATSADTSLATSLLCCTVWPMILILPLLLTSGLFHYSKIFPRSWYDEEPVKPTLGPYGMANPLTVKPLGLTLGIMAVAVGQVFMLFYHYLRRSAKLGKTSRIQKEVRAYDWREGLASHLFQPEGFALIGGYLSGTWMLGWMPASYYSFSGGICWWHVAAQILLQDFFQYLMHFAEHKVHPWIYKQSHKPHHRFTNPRLFDAFDGSLADTVVMIVLPFILVARIVPANVWSYMAFGSLYANWLVLIHSEYAHPWDVIFRSLGFGTPADHHVHHRLFVFNYGHLFLYWDRVFGTYKNPDELKGKFFN
mmetsp:Transcript_93557/g.195037  ORF Transcript_93557/g.195037 Transcript_93557/m.195037 type:complete len:334 (-) Transcript_93557:156-1157(-)